MLEDCLSTKIEPLKISRNIGIIKLYNNIIMITLEEKCD